MDSVPIIIVKLDWLIIILPSFFTVIMLFLILDASGGTMVVDLCDSESDLEHEQPNRLLAIEGFKSYYLLSIILTFISIQ